MRNMELFKAYRGNDAAEPWLAETEWQFDIQLTWNQWLFGASRWADYGGVVWTLHIGPLVFNYYHNGK